MAFDFAHLDPIASRFNLDPGGFRAALMHMWGGPNGSQAGGAQPNWPMLGGGPWWMHPGAAQGTPGAAQGNPLQMLQGLLPQNGVVQNLLTKAGQFGIGGGTSGPNGSPSAYTGQGPGGFNPQTGQGSF